MPSHTYRILREDTLRRGRPRRHWAELTLSEAYCRHLHLSQSPSPPLAEVNHPFFQPPTATEISELHRHSLVHWGDNIHLYRPLRTVANHRKNWQLLSSTLLRHPPSGGYYLQ